MKTESDNNTQTCRQFPAETKLQILKEGRSTHLTISQVCEHHQISPRLFYQREWIADRAALAALRGQHAVERNSAPPRSTCWPRCSACKR